MHSTLQLRSSPRAYAAQPVNETCFKEYLAGHPEYLKEHPELYEEVGLPTDTDI
jgi:hypothetical protein